MSETMIATCDGCTEPLGGPGDPRTFGDGLPTPDGRDFPDPGRYCDPCHAHRAAIYTAFSGALDAFEAAALDGQDDRDARAALWAVLRDALAVPRVAVTLEGGLVQDVSANVPVRVIVADFDVDFDVDGAVCVRDAAHRPHRAYVHEETPSVDGGPFDRMVAAMQEPWTEEHWTERQRAREEA